MELRDATLEDLQYAAEHSASRGKSLPAQALKALVGEDGELLAVGGVMMLSESTAWAGVNFTDEGHNRMIFVYRLVRDYLDGLFEDERIRLVLFSVRADFPEAIRMAEGLGFTKMVDVPEFFAGEPGLIYARRK